MPAWHRFHSVVRRSSPRRKTNRYLRAPLVIYVAIKLSLQIGLQCRSAQLPGIRRTCLTHQIGFRNARLAWVGLSVDWHGSVLPAFLGRKPSVVSSRWHRGSRSHGALKGCGAEQRSKRNALQSLARLNRSGCPGLFTSSSIVPVLSLIALFYTPRCAQVFDMNWYVIRSKPISNRFWGFAWSAAQFHVKVAFCTRWVCCVETGLMPIDSDSTPCPKAWRHRANFSGITARDRAKIKSSD